MAITLSVETGAKLYEIKSENGTLLASFEMNPANPALFQRLVDFSKIGDEVNAEFEDVQKKIENNEDVDYIAKTMEISNKIAHGFDEILGYEASKTLFHFISPITPINDNGDMFFAKVIEIIQNLITEAQEKSIKRLERVEAATAEYD